MREIPVLFSRLKHELGRRIIGQDLMIRDLFMALIAQGHCLMVGVPGLAKTLLIKSLAEATDLSFCRIQFTPDLMPSDITGSEILEETDNRRRAFRFTSGPVFSQLLLADEINRAPAKTQSALLEGMEERRVTTGGVTRDLPRPFFVLATQNPIEQEGTYPLPEAQLDRFIFCLRVGYPTAVEEAKILETTTRTRRPALQTVCTAEKLLAMQEAVREVHVPTSVVDLTVRLVRASRPDDPSAPAIVKRCVRWGAGPRATQSLALAAKVTAALDGRLNCCADDVTASARIVLRHRLVLNYRAEADQIDADGVVDQLVQAVKP
jgi:MoxR-like ATPase